MIASSDGSYRHPVLQILSDNRLATSVVAVDRLRGGEEIESGVALFSIGVC